MIAIQALCDLARGQIRSCKLPHAKHFPIAEPHTARHVLTPPPL